MGILDVVIGVHIFVIMFLIVKFVYIARSIDHRYFVSRGNLAVPHFHLLILFYTKIL